MDDSFKWDGIAGCAALLSEVTGCSALRSEVAGCSALLELLGGSALPELLGAAEDKKRFMAPSRKLVSHKMSEPKTATVMKIDFKLQHAQTE